LNINLKNQDGITNLGWTEMVEQLGPAGMSSDESKVDEGTKKLPTGSVNVLGEAMNARIA
jgi:hypothetical protein